MADPPPPPTDLDADLKRHDPDRWLSSRLVADPARRAALVALYAFDNELAAVAARAQNPMMGEIRLAWWAEEVRGALGGGAVSTSPVARALAASRDLLSIEALEALIEARHADLDPTPFADEGALTGYLDAVDGGVMSAAGKALAPEVKGGEVAHAARAWGWIRLLRRQESVWRRRPEGWWSTDEAELGEHLRHRVIDALHAARAEVAGLPVAAFPAVAHATFAWPYAAGRQPGDLEKRARLLIAAARGRI